MCFVIFAEDVGEVSTETQGAYNVIVSWTDTEQDAEGYYIELQPINSTEAKFHNGTVNDVNTTSYTADGLVPGTQYKVSVAACRSCDSDEQVLGPKNYSNQPAQTSKCTRVILFLCCYIWNQHSQNREIASWVRCLGSADLLRDEFK